MAMCTFGLNLKLPRTHFAVWHSLLFESRRVVRSFFRLRKCAFLSGVLAMIFFAGACDNSTVPPQQSTLGNFTVSKEDQLAAALFDTARDTARSVQERRAAAARLVRMQEGAVWAVNLLLGCAYPEEVQARIVRGEPSRLAMDIGDRAVIASVLENIDPQANAALLWAATFHLSDTQAAEHAEEEQVHTRWGGLVSDIRRSQNVTEPVRDLARGALKQALGVDHGYDPEAWRKEILKQAAAEDP